MPRLIGKLPPDAEATLKAAAQTGEPGSMTRTIAIEKAYARIAALHPELFKREEKMAKVTVLTRTAFLNVFTPTAFEGGEPAFNGKFIIDPADKATVKALDDAMMAAAKEKWADKAQAIFDKLTKTGKPKNLEVPFVKEPYSNADGEPYDGFAGMYYVSARNPSRPLVIDRDKTVLVEADGRPYSGCYVNAQFEFWAQDNKWGRAIRATLKGVQFVKDGDAFSGGAPASVDDFDVVDGGADAGDLV